MIEYSSSQIYQQMRSILSQWTIKTSHSKTFWDSNLSAVVSWHIFKDTTVDLKTKIKNDWDDKYIYIFECVKKKWH